MRSESTVSDRASDGASEGMVERPSGTGTAVTAGTFVAFGSLAVVMAIVGAVGSNLGLKLDGVSWTRWRQAGIGGAALACLVLFACFLFGGYTAGRMAARRGAAHGLLVFLLCAVVIGVVVAIAAIWGDTSNVTDRLRSNGVPTDANTWSDIGIGAAIAATHALVADVEHRRTTERHYRGDTEVVDLRDDEEHPEYLPSLEEERERRHTASEPDSTSADSVGQ
ncbi:MAG: YrzE family protein [Acidobacteria bacterium]|nr:YrzE family protein [Acidobacteriota bacterium]